MLTDLLAALAVVVNGIPQGLLALMYGFAVGLPTSGSAYDAIHSV